MQLQLQLQLRNGCVAAAAGAGRLLRRLRATRRRTAGWTLPARLNPLFNEWQGNTVRARRREQQQGSPVSWKKTSHSNPNRGRWRGAGGRGAGGRMANGWIGDERAEAFGKRGKWESWKLG